MIFFVALLVVWVVLCVRLSKAFAERGGRSRAAGAQRSAVRQRLRSLPEGHRPPPGLGPLSPSERFLTSEADRGLRDLQRYLGEQGEQAA